LLGLAAYAESFSNHPIALSILKEYGKPPIKDIHGEYEEMAGYGVRATLEGSSILAGNEKLMEKMGIAYAVPETVGTNVHVAKDGVYAGCLTIADEIKPGSRALVPALKELGVRKTVMLTGDLPRIAADIGRELELDEVHAGLLPRQKVEKVEELARQKLPRKTLAFVGDGINDAPVLALADVGVAMGGLGSDAAIEAADIVLMTDEPEKLVEAVRIARFTRHVVWQNIALALGIKFLFLFLATLGVSTLWEAVFADVGVSLLAVLNSMRVVFRLPA
ncbi:MAG: HAD-IC family P-type ATPase, partial [Treponema sp.]|nr:HAD-IC family P-type ATPase [Treponema sp.]